MLSLHFLQVQAIVPLLAKRLLLRLQTATLKSSNNRNKHWYLNNRLPSLSCSPVIVHTVAIARIVHTAATVRTARIVHTIRVDKELGKIRMGVDFSAPILIYQKSVVIFAITIVITLEHNNEELRNTNGCYLVTQFSSNPTNRFILSELSFLAKVI